MAEKIGKIEKMVRDHEKRISELEKAVFVERVETKRKPEFKGLSGGIEYLISKSFLDIPKSVKEVQEELKKEGYHYSYESVDKLLRIDFMTKRKILTRIKEDRVWKYVIRK